MGDLLDSILDPSAVISDQYGSQVVFDTSGGVAEGLAQEHIEPSTLSQIPNGLVDTLNPEELRDLIAYLLAGGDKKADVFKEPKGGGSGR